ncbi:MAG: hypothetical protein GEU93_00310 [Propionibacteriales bacterium]|nr:hypothetical protein [Propionibacteriales bacterium]
MARSRHRGSHSAERRTGRLPVIGLGVLAVLILAGGVALGRYVFPDPGSAVPASPEPFVGEVVEFADNDTIMCVRPDDSEMRFCDRFWVAPHSEVPELGDQVSVTPLTAIDGDGAPQSAMLVSLDVSSRPAG